MIQVVLVLVTVSIVLSGFNDPGFCDVSTFTSSTYKPELNSPPKSIVTASSKSICIAELVNTAGNVSYQSGVLIHPKLVVTTMHGLVSIDEPGWPIIDNVSGVRVKFNYLSGGIPAANWINVIDMDPKPGPAMKSTECLPVYKDFVVLELEKAQPQENVSKCNLTKNINDWYANG